MSNLSIVVLLLSIESIESMVGFNSVVLEVSSLEETSIASFSVALSSALSLISSSELTVVIIGDSETTSCVLLPSFLLLFLLKRLATTIPLKKIATHAIKIAGFGIFDVELLELLLEVYFLTFFASLL